MSNLFISIPETTLPGGLTVPAFQVGQYVCNQGNDGKATVTAEGKPWVNINYHDARKACEAAGFKLLTESQWLAIAWNASQQDCNWTKGKVGQGKLFMGLRRGGVRPWRVQAGTFEPSNKKERRWLTLSNGERICDLNGNVWQWIFDDVQGDENGLVARAFTGDSPSIATAPFPSLEKGMGWRPSAGSDGSGDALVRGGGWYSRRVAGAFSLSYVWPSREWGSIGFRCTL